MATQLDLYNAALGYIGERPLSSLDEDRTARRDLDIVWNTGFIDRVLSAAQWKFAMRTVKLTACTGSTPNFGFQYAYSKPADLVRLAKFSSEETEYMPENNYRSEAGFWLTNVTPIYVTYVSNMASYGGNLGEWPPLFTAFAELELASRIIMRLTNAPDLLKQVMALKTQARKEAEAVDAMEGPTEFPPVGSWNRARRGGQWRRDYGRRDRLIG